ncbi:GDP-mannose transporter into the lumen of the Golgi [Marasmius crinis-equi]|uniref:GDP-mannose transporter into the lumen of the Golgi n=1 Tax=Marasmius crinis-equi TaxID=585013 RepID=A0ABR3FEX1_9AGAR
MALTHRYLLVLLVANILGLVLQVAGVSNQTIDDSNVQFTYSGSWLVNSCSGCSPRPDSGQAFNQTYHTSGDGDGSGSARLVFTGSAIWVYGILAPSGEQGALTITLDAQSPVVYNSTGNSDSTYAYNALFFHASSLQSTVSHTLTLRAGRAGSVLLDCAVVSSDEPTATGTGSP